MLAEALRAGFIGMSSQQLLFDKLDGETCRSRTLPSTYAKPRELRRLKSVLRRSGRVLQAGPDIQNPFNIASQAVQSLGIGRRQLKTTLLSAADIKANPWLIALMGPAARLVNKLGGNFRWQHLPVPFEVYADGIDLVIFEEFGSGAAAMHLKEQVAERNDLLRDEDYRRRFRKDYDSKYGLRVWHRDFFDAEIVACPDVSVIGKSFGQVGIECGGLHPVDAFLDLVVEHGTALRWHTTISNHRPEVLKKMAREPGIQMGFSDAGAHLRNMAFYNFGLRLLRHVYDAQKAGTPFMTIEEAVHRLTGELADWYHIDAGHLRMGDRADLVIVDPAHLDDSLDGYAEEKVEQYGGLSRMVNRNDDTVSAVLVVGRAVFLNGQPTEVLGTQRTGSFLRANTTTPATTGTAAEPVATAV
jgi:N-acyl-D-aspartate/D-glutamate deacylase